MVDDKPGIRRTGRAKQFRYVRANGRACRDDRTLSRIRALAIPPAWTDVWISPNPDEPVQATGRDARGRKQYRYHAEFRAEREAEKYARLVELLRVLPKVRRAVTRDLACRCLCKRKVIATVVSLMERAQLRVGNDEYARQNNSYGATTLRDHHATIRGGTVELAYRAKGGAHRRVRVRDRKLAAIVRACRDLPGQRLFQYVDGDAVKRVTASDVNAYLREVSGAELTAKDYRTWAATLGACLLLCVNDKANVKDVLACVAENLGHTVTVCKKSYVHPALLEDFAAGKLAALSKQVRRKTKAGNFDVAALRAIEPLVARYLTSRSSSSRSKRRSRR